METPETQVKTRKPRSTGRRLSQQNIAKWAVEFAPTNTKMADLLRSFLKRKNWSIQFFCTLWCVPEMTVIRLFKDLEAAELSSHLRRLLWMICVFDEKPDMLVHPWKVATWGTTEIAAIGKKAKVSSQRMWNLKTELKMLKNDPSHSPMTIPDICNRWHLPRRIAVKICKGAEYIPAKGLWGEKSFFLHTPLVREINWNLSSGVLAEKFPDYARGTFQLWRRKIAMIPHERLLAIIVEYHLEPTYYGPFFGGTKMVTKKNLKNKLTTPEPVVGCEQNETATENVADTRFAGITQPAAEQTHGEAGSGGAPEGVSGIPGGCPEPDGRTESGGEDVPAPSPETGEDGFGLKG